MLLTHQVLSAEIEQLQCALEQERRQHEASLTAALAEATAAAETAQEESDNLLQRMLFMERHLAVLRSASTMCGSRCSNCFVCCHLQWYLATYTLW